MKKNIISEMRLVGSIEDTSILRKFTTLFMLMSLLPMGILFYFYLQIRDQGQIALSLDDYNVMLIFIVLGVTVGYFAMRSVLKKLIDLANANKKALENVLSPDKIRELSKEKNEIAILAQSFSVITNRLEENVKSLELAKRTIHAVMSRVGQGMSSMHNINTFLNLILETITAALSAKVGVLMLVDEKDVNQLIIKSVYGLHYDLDEEVKIKIDEGTTLYTAIRTRTPLIVPRIFSESSKKEEHDYLFQAPLICAPLLLREKVIGVVTISGRKMAGNFDEDEMNMLFNIASQTAVAIENSRLSKNIEKTYFETISALALAVDAKDTYSRGHLDRVAQYCVQIAKRLGLDDEDINTLRDAAKLHDLGKIGIPDDVLRKPGTLTDEEWLLMRKHPEIGESIIKPIKSLEHLCDLIRHHHELLDGSGYPDALKGDEIAPLVRIISIADIYDALTTNRSYRDKMNLKRAGEVLRGLKEQIDQDVVNVFLETLSENPADYFSS